MERRAKEAPGIGVGVCGRREGVRTEVGNGLMCLGDIVQQNGGKSLGQRALKRLLLQCPILSVSNNFCVHF